MALGGGTWLSQNKVLPGAYINFISAARAQAVLSDRGVAALPLSLDWGPEDAVFSVTTDEFQKDSLKIFGYSYTAPELQGLRDMFLNIRLGYFYRLNSGGTKAENAFATAKHPGTRGNEIIIVITNNEAATEEAPLFDVVTRFGGVVVDEQVAVTSPAELQPSDYAIWKSGAALTLTAGTPLTGGTNGAVADGNYQVFLDKIEGYSFNTLGLISTDATLKGLFANFTKRMRDDVGVKFQTVLYRYDFDFEGVISVENKLMGEAGDTTDSAGLVYWTLGAQAGCLVNASLSNAKYSGEMAVDVNYTQLQLENALKAGKFIFHRVHDDVRVLEDVNTFTSFTVDKNVDFSSNQTMRVLDQIGNDIAALFNNSYLGKVANDAAGRISLWNDIVSHHRELERLRAITDFDPDTLTVEQGATKKAVVVTDYVTPVNAMAQLYMSVVVL